MEKLNLPPFYVGQKVVCIQSHPMGFFKKGQEFTIIDARKMKCCADWVVDIGIHTHYLEMDCSCCGATVDNISYYRSSRFAPIQESKFKAVTFEKICEEVELICEN